MKLSQYIFLIKTPLDSGEEVTLIYSTKTGGFDFLSNETAQELLAGNIDILTFDQRKTLTDLGMLVPSKLDEYKTMITRKKKQYIDRSELFVSINDGPTFISCQKCHGEVSINKYNHGGGELIAALKEFLKEKKYTKLVLNCNLFETNLDTDDFVDFYSQIKLLAEENEMHFGAFVTVGYSQIDEGFFSLVKKIPPLVIDVIVDSLSIMNSTEAHRPLDFTNIRKLLAQWGNFSHIAITLILHRSDFSKTEYILESLVTAKLQGAYVSIFTFEKSESVAVAEEFSKLELNSKMWLQNNNFNVVFLPKINSPASVFSFLTQNEQIGLSKVYHCSSSNHQMGRIINKISDFYKYSLAIQCKDCRVLPLCGGSCTYEWNNYIPCPSYLFTIEDRILKTIEDYQNRL